MEEEREPMIFLEPFDSNTSDRGRDYVIGACKFLRKPRMNDVGVRFFGGQEARLHVLSTAAALAADLESGDIRIPEDLRKEVSKVLLEFKLSCR
ncbi:MAG: hypothetical protein ABSC19_01530 [Syntrophorhabdales bacterium]|jgi:hypothetical protein